MLPLMSSRRMPCISRMLLKLMAYSSPVLFRSAASREVNSRFSPSKQPITRLVFSTLSASIMPIHPFRQSILILPESTRIIKYLRR